MAHVGNILNSFEKSRKIILASNYYFEGITGLLKNYIKQCTICQIKIKAHSINVPERPIIDKGPHDEYQMDLFYLDEDIVEKTSYKYIASIIDHFSKWMWSYCLKSKTGRECLLCLMNYTYAFGIPNKLHTDNGLEFKNIHFNLFCEDNNITHQFSKPYNPKSAGCIVA